MIGRADRSGRIKPNKIHDPLGRKKAFCGEKYHNESESVEREW